MLLLLLPCGRSFLQLLEDTESLPQRPEAAVEEDGHRDQKRLREGNRWDVDHEAPAFHLFLATRKHSVRF